MPSQTVEISLSHSLPGRSRFRVNIIRRKPEIVSRLEALVKHYDAISSMQASSITGSILIEYNDAKLTPSRIEQWLRSAVTDSLSQPLLERSSPPHVEESSVNDSLWRFLGLTAAMGGFLVRQFLFALPVAQGPFTPLGALTMAASLPLLRRSVERFRQERRVSLESFLGGTAVAAVIAGEAGTALEVLWIHSGAGLLTSWITERSRQAISEIMQISDPQVFMLVDEVEVAVAVDSLTVGALVAVHTDERISVDGQVARGSALVDESPITGRAEFALRQAGDPVFAGTIVREGWLHVRAERVGKATYLAHIFQMVEESLENKAPIEGVADQLARTLVNLGFVATTGTLLLTGSLWNAFTVMLVMACPCATALAASTAVNAAINRAARRHILIKGGRYLEEIGKAEVVCFDKTGTLTTGRASLQTIVSVEDGMNATLLEWAAAAEGHSRHPLALALVSHAKASGLTLFSPDLSESFLGMGVRAVWIEDKSEILVGNHKLMDRFHIPMGAAHGAPDFLPADHTVVYVAKNGNLLGWLVFSQQLRTDAHAVIAQLRETGVTQTLLVTGDENSVAQALATSVGLDLCYASVLPEEKARLVTKFGHNGHVVIMVGDGVNDALALAKADVGVAMGAGGSAVAIEAADIALVRDDLRDLVFTHSLSQQTLRVVHQNFWIATGSNVIGVMLGATGQLSPLAAGLLHIVHTLGVLANSSRLLRYDSHEADRDLP